MRFYSSDIMQSMRARLERLYGSARADRLIERLALLCSRFSDDLVPKSRSGALWDQRDNLLITYGDMVTREGEAPLATLKGFLDKRVGDAFSSVHLLPVFPYSSDEGFSVVDYRTINPNLGTWSDIRTISTQYQLMLDLVINHVSRKSTWFEDYVNGTAPYRHYFIEVDSDVDLSAVIRPRTQPLLTPTRTRTGEHRVWTTFSPDQVDLDFANPDVLFEFMDILLCYVSQGARMIRLDAIAFLWKEVGTPCFHHPHTHEVVKLLRDLLKMLAPDVILITETNVPHPENISYFGRGDEAQMVYQFSLPPLLLHALLNGNADYLSEWAANLEPPPAGCTFLNFTASHDGIGVRPLEGIIPEAEQAKLIEDVLARGGLVSMRDANGEARPYELNSTYYDALAERGQGRVDQQVARFLCSQTTTLGLQGIPAVYFHSLTATPNHQAGVVNGQARAINRRRWQLDELDTLLDDTNTATSRVFREYIRRLKLRSGQAAFHPDAAQRVVELGEGLFSVVRTPTTTAGPLLAVSNLTGNQKQFSIRSAGYEFTGTDAWCDLLADGEHINKHDNIELAPYQVRWLTLA